MSTPHRTSTLRRAVAATTAFAFLATSAFSVQASIKSEMDKLYKDVVGIVKDPIETIGDLPGDIADGFKDFPSQSVNSIMASGPSSFKGQTFHTAMGGQVFQRTPVRNLQLMTIEKPHFAAGCGGIDMTFGSISHLDGKKIVDFLKAVAMNMEGVIVQVALGAITPLLASKLEWAKDVVDKINGFNKNSCEVAQSLVAGGANAITMDANRDCVENRMIYDGLNIDEAREKCSSASGMKEVTDRAGTAKAPNKFTGNLTWEALKTAIGTDNDSRDEREMIMSMIGSVIYFKDGADTHPPLLSSGGTPPPPTTGGSTATTPEGEPKGQARDDDHGEMVANGIDPFKLQPTISNLEDFLYGVGAPATGKVNVTLWKCDDATACLNPTRTTVAIDSLSDKVATDMRNIADSIRSRSPLSVDQIRIINESTLPIYKMLSLGTMVKGSSLAEQLIETYKDVIAADHAWALISKNIKAGQEALSKKYSLNDTQAADLKDILTESYNRMRDLRAQKEAAQRKVSDINAVSEVLKDLERIMASSTPERVLAMTSGTPGAGATGRK